MRQIYVLVLALCASVACLAQEPLSGKFTVNEQGDQVQFAPGNLQYIISSGTWQFAASQTQVVGVSKSYAMKHPDNYDVADLFHWDEDYSHSISSDWRMLTKAEWEYLLREEEPGDGNGPIIAGQASINGTLNGLILVPDEWQAFGELNFYPSPNNWTKNSYSAANWTELEASGVVFLPCVDRYGDNGFYWSATQRDVATANLIYFYESGIMPDYAAAMDNNYAIRLVKDVKETPTDLKPTPDPSQKGGEKVLRDGQLYLIYKGTMYNVQGQRIF